MTVADLIAELQQHPPQKQVRVLAATITVDTEVGEKTLAFGSQHAKPAYDVRNEGAYVLIESR